VLEPLAGCVESAVKQGGLVVFCIQPDPGGEQGVEKVERVVAVGQFFLGIGVGELLLIGFEYRTERFRLECGRNLADEAFGGLEPFVGEILRRFLA